MPGLAAVVEIAPSLTGRVPVELIREAYRASRRGTVALVLNGVSSEQVDRALDRIVRRVRDVAGVVYCTPATLTPLLRKSGRPKVAWIGSGELVDELAKVGVVVLPLLGRKPLRVWSHGRESQS